MGNGSMGILRHDLTGGGSAAPFHGTINKSPPLTAPMPSVTFPLILKSCSDANGTIPWSTACQSAKDHGLFDDFRTDYGQTAAFGRVDAGEFLIWLGY